MQGGFTLVEMAVVLVVVGLVMAAVLQGRELISSAEYKSFKGELREYHNAFFAFRDRFDALPGDFAEADIRLDGMDANDNGNGNGQIEPSAECDDAVDESCLAWQHLRAAGMIGGNPNDDAADASPGHAYGGSVASFFTGTEGNGSFGHKIAVEDVPAEVARRLDREVDDDLCNNGRVAGLSPSADCAASSSEDWPDGAGSIDMIYGL